MDGGSMEEADKELVASNPEPRNWKGIVISVAVILFVILMVGGAVWWKTPPDQGPRVKGERILLDNILEDKYKPVRYNATYVGSSLIYMDASGGLSLFSPLDGSTENILENSTFRTLNSLVYRVDPSLQYVLIIHDIQSIFRHSTFAKYTIQDIKHRTSPLVRLGVQTKTDILHDQEYLQYAIFRPGGGVVFISQNDIFFLPSLEGGSPVVRVTDTGAAGTIYNGVADWLYEEEILGQTQAVWSSGEGSNLLYATFNDSNVDLVTLREYGNSHYRPGARPREKSFRYPKAGSRNPAVVLSVYSFSDSQTVQVVPPPEIKDRDHYFISCSWTSEQVVSILWTNRQQNTTIYTLCSHPDFVCKQIFVEKAGDTVGAGWVDNWGIPTFSKDGSEMIKIHPVLEGKLGYFPQLVLASVSTTDLLPTKQLTQGHSEVTSILGWDEDNEFVYYMSTLEGRPGERHLFRVNPSTLDNEQLTGDRGLPTNQSVDMDPNNLNLNQSLSLFSCLYSRIHLSPNFDSYVQECLGPDIPWTVVMSLPNNSLLAVLDTNEKLKKQVNISSMPGYDFMEVPLPGSILPARVKLTLPPVLRMEEDFTFPLIINVYGGPGTQTVDHRWSVGWDTYLASRRDFVVANIDVRGSGYQGINLKHAVKGQLGTVETEDILHTVRILMSSLKYVDGEKVCIWGWSFGGYITGRVLAEDGRMSQQGRSRTLRCGIAVAPVTEWHNYDSAYTEKYMGMPDPAGNWKGYLESSLSSKVSYIADNTLMVLHGTADDNVHVQHTMLLSKQLVQNHVIFRQQLYPDENHGLFGVIRHQHLTMEAFFDQVFGPMQDYFQDDYFMAAANLLKEIKEKESCQNC